MHTDCRGLKMFLEPDNFFEIKSIAFDVVILGVCSIHVFTSEQILSC
jgi:hypothetical protein